MNLETRKVLELDSLESDSSSTTTDNMGIIPVPPSEDFIGTRGFRIC